MVSQSYDYKSHLYDDLYPNHHQITIETMDEVFALSTEMKLFVDETVLRKDTLKQKVSLLAEGIFDHANFSILYQNDANTTASETFANGRANCLSLTIMTYSMARYAGLGVDFQEIRIPELWVRRDSTNLLNRHVNLRLFERRKGDVIVVTKTDFTIDFNQLTGSRYFPQRVISKQRILSMFYNNKGVDALLDNDNETAYAYFKRGMTVDDSLVDNYTNLGVLYSRLGLLEKAENIYNYALTIRPDDGTTLENLAILYKTTNRLAKAQQIRRNLEYKRRNNPYYYYLLGQQALEQSKYKKARKHFAEAIELQSRNHEFYFAMAKTLYLMGDVEMSEKYLNRALKYTDSKIDQNRYQSKLDSYSQLFQEHL